ncbi:hypothetical protein [Leifsonia aquatica]|uniref:hypothetical protein n=1 Tax=Leifsonia aquatica TaxID=144185 RepID=UPI00380AAC5B
MTDDDAMLPGFGDSTADPGKAGYVETETRKQIEKLRELGYIQDHHAGQVALAIVTARALDQSGQRGAASGRANLSRAMKEIFEMLPAPEVASTDDLKLTLDRILAEEDSSTDGV